MDYRVKQIPDGYTDWRETDFDIIHTLNRRRQACGLPLLEVPEEEKELYRIYCEIFEQGEYMYTHPEEEIVYMDRTGTLIDEWNKDGPRVKDRYFYKVIKRMVDGGTEEEEAIEMAAAMLYEECESFSERMKAVIFGESGLPS